MRSDARLRRGQAKQQQLYSRRDANWIEWGDAQKARMTAEKAYKALPATAAPARKLQALKEWLIICLHTVQPPDRVVLCCRSNPPLVSTESCAHSRVRSPR